MRRNFTTWAALRIVVMVEFLNGIPRVRLGHVPSSWLLHQSRLTTREDSPTIEGFPADLSGQRIKVRGRLVSETGRPLTSMTVEHIP